MKNCPAALPLENQLSAALPGINLKAPGIESRNRRIEQGDSLG
jgi:hypothetical protein